MQMPANLQLDFKVGFFFYTRMKTFYIGKIQLLGLGAGKLGLKFSSNSYVGEMLSLSNFVQDWRYEW